MLLTRRFSYTLAFALAAPCIAGPPPEEHFDIWLHALDGQIVTGSITEDGIPLADVHHVFGAELGEDPLFPFSAFEPGFQTDSVGFGSLTLLTFSILSTLQLWNGNGFDAADETMLIEFGPASVSTAEGFVPGFNFATDSAGYLHDHFDFTLNGSTGDPNPGIYLLSLSIAGLSPIYQASDPFFLVFNLGQDEADHDAAIDWVQSNLVATPPAFAVLAGLLLARRRRRSSVALEP